MMWLAWVTFGGEGGIYIFFSQAFNYSSASSQIVPSSLAKYI